MSKKKEEGLKSFNKGFSVPDTYIIIFFVGCPCCDRYVFVPKGYYEITGCYVHDERGGEDPYGN